MAEENSVPTVDIGNEEVWREELVVTFDQRASLQIARWVLMLFAGVYLFCFVMGFVMLFLEGATFDGALEIVKFMIASILPLVTLAVGYYLGDKSTPGGNG